MSGVGRHFAGAVVGAVFTELYEAVKDVKEKPMMFKSLLGDLKSTLESLNPLIVDMEKYNKLLDRPQEELQNFVEQMKEGAVLVRKCLKVGRLNAYKKYKYANQLLDLVKCLNRLFTILNVVGLRDEKEILNTVKIINENIKKLQIKEEVVIQNQLESKAWCAVPELAPVKVVGFDEPLRDLKKMFLEDDVSMLVLTAHGGSGKTTLATQFCHDKDVKDKFKNNIFFVTVSKKPNLDVVQELYQQMESQPPTFQSDVTAVMWLEEVLKEAGKNPLLLVLDDVWLTSKSLLQKFDKLKMPNNKILVTSRFQFPECGTPYHLKSLNDIDSLTLFLHSASLGNRSSDIPEDLLEEIVEHCKGFPLAISVIGTSLRGKPIEFWCKRVREWSKSSILYSESELLLCLQSSLDALDEKDVIIKEYFMDLGSFPKDQRIPAAVFIDMWAELYELDEDYLCILILLELTNRNLANLVVTRKEKMDLVDGYYVEHFVTQHDMLRELSIYNTKLDPIEQRKRLIVDISGDNEPKWLTEQKSQPIKARLLSISSDDVLSTKWQNIQLPEVEVLVLNFQTKSYALPEFVEKIDKLKAVIVTNYGFVPAELSNFQLLGSLSNLKRIRLERISIPSITKNSVPLKSLKKISLFMCSIGEAFSNGSITISDALPKLEEMNIDYCHDLVELPAELCDLIELKKLSITNCRKLSALPEDIGNLVNLKLLRLRSCTDLVKLPGSIKNLTKLDTLDISDCFNIRDLPEEFGEISSLTKLNKPEPPLITVGLEIPLRDLKRKLLKEGVSMVVITAIGGGGKTTLAKQFCQDEQVKDKFKNNIFFVTVLKEANLEHIVEQLCQQKGLQLSNNLEIEAIAVQCLQQFMEEVGQNPLLLVLDDVWSGSEYILEKFDEFKTSNSKILVTSRFEFLGFGSPFNLRSLDEEDAMTLFHHSVSHGDKESYIPEDLQEKIVERCKGLPIAITVVGRSLRGKPMHIWRQRIDELSEGASIFDFDPDVDLLDCLKSSLDALDKEKAIIKECFMDLGSFPGNHTIPVAALIDMWAELYELGDDIMCIANLHELSTRGLANFVITRKEKIEADGYYCEHFVTIHDMLRDLAIHVIKKVQIENRERVIIDICGDNLPKWLTEHKYQPVNARLLSVTSDGVFSAEWNNIQLPKAEVMVLNFRKKNYALPEFVEKVRKLKVLIVMNKSSLAAELSNFQLLGSLSNLKRIRLDGISIPSITKTPTKLTSLQKISLFMCHIGQAFTNCSIQVSDVFPNLVEMNIDNCNDLVNFPTELCDLIHLKKLSITNCHKLSILAEKIGKLVNLEVLRLRSCTDLVELPSSITNLKKLELLDISYCHSIMEFPKDIDELSSLRKLNMIQCSKFQKLPPSIVDLEQLSYVLCDEVTEKLWNPFLTRLKKVSIKVVKEDTDSNSLTTMSPDNDAVTRMENREVMDDTVTAELHAELKAEIKVVKAGMKEMKSEMKEMKSEMKALKDEFSPLKNKLDLIIDLLTPLKQSKSETEGDETTEMK